MKKLLLLAVSLVFTALSVNKAYACHAIALVSPTSQVLANGSGIQVTASSDSPTCGCDVYWMDIEVRCNSSSDPFTGGPLTAGVWVPYASYPFFQSQQMVKNNCVVQQYPWVTIPYSGLCPGVTYKYRMRENHNGQVGPWTSTFTFTVPGVQAPLQVTASANPTTLCGPGSVQLSSTITGGCSSNKIITWSPSTGLSSTSVANPTANVSSTTTYTVTYQDLCSNQTATASVTITVAPTPVPGTASISPATVCPGQTTTLTLTGYSANSTIQWQSSSSPSGPWTNIGGATTTPYTTGAINAVTYYQAVVMNACGTATSNTVSVSITGPPNVTATASPATVCAGSPSTLTATGASTYTWMPGSLSGSSVTVTPAVTTTYTVTGATASGCTNTATVTVTVAPSPSVTVTASPASICSGASSTLTATGASTYTWSPGNLTGASVTVTPSATTTYIVTGTSASGCTNTASVTVTVDPLPVVSATASPASICPGSQSTLTATGASTYTWSPGNLSGASVTVTPSATTTYVVTGTSAAGCTGTATVTVSLNGTINITAAASPASICIGSSSTLTASGASTYTWNPGNLSGTSVTVTPSATTIYSVTGIDANGCQGSTTVTVTVNPLPAPTASASPTSVCPGASSTLTATGGSTYTWNPGNLNGASVNVTPSATTTYTVTALSAAGCQNTASVTVTVNPGPTVTASASPASICIGASSTLTATGANTYTWMPGNLTGTSVTVSPTVTTTYTVSGMTSAGCPGTDTVTVIVNSPATLVLLATDVLCFGGNTGTTTVTASGGTQPYTYSWNTTPVQTTQTATGLTAGNYSVTVTTADGCISTGTVVCGQPTLLTLSVAGFDATCNGACNGQVVVIPSGGTPQYQYAWSNGCNSPSCNSLCAGPYSITVTDANGCTATGSATVNEPPALVLTTSAITANCNQADGQASVTVTGGTPNYTYSWNTNPVQPGSTATSLFPGPYTVTVTDNYTCTATATVTVPNAPGVAASISSSVNATCNGSCNGSATAQGAGGTGPYTYSWSTSPAQNTQTASNLCAGTYTVTITDTNGCSDTAIVTITEPALVVASPNTPAAICIGQCVTLTSTATGGTGGYTYSWSGGATVCPVVTTTYGVIATDINGCTSATANVTVTVNPPLDVVATGTTAICPGASTPLSATGSGGNGGPYSYQWLPGTGLNNPAIANPSASPSATTTYTVYVSDQCGTPVDSAMVTVTINPLPFVVISSDITAACDTPGCITFADLSTISSGSIVGWAWNFGDNNTSNLQNPSYCYGGPGSYGVTLTATSAQGCVASVFAPYPITIYPEPVAEFNFGPQPTTIASPEICFTDASLFADTWSWDFADPSDITTSTQQNPCHFYSDTGTYCVDLIVTTMNGCNDTVTHCLVIGPDFLIYVPNAFSPNGDNTNDNFVARGIGIDEDNFELFIFDRWGNRIFYTDNYDKGWNGKANGGNEVAQQDVYVWKIVVKDIMGSSHQYMGHVTLIK